MNNTSNDSNPSKKRKANNDRRQAMMDAVQHSDAGSNNKDFGSLSFSGRRDETSPGPPWNGNETSQLNRMESIMMRMEEKLATVSNLESRCEQLERKCSSLENMILESTSQLTLASKQIGDKVNSVDKKLERSLKFHEYNKMMIQNQGWVYPCDDQVLGFPTDDEDKHVIDTAEELKEMTITMRRGEFPSGYDEAKGIYLRMDDGQPIFNYAVNNELLPYWQEFANALTQFTPAINLLSDNVMSYFRFYFVQLNSDAMLLIKNALIGKPFQRLAFTNNDTEYDARGIDSTRGFAHGGMSVDAILDIVESNKHLRKLEIERNQIGTQHIERLCSAVRNRHLVSLDLSNSFEPGIADEMLASLLTIGDLKLEILAMNDNNITSIGGTLLADFLATNPTLKKLYLSGSNLNDSDAALFANALRSNRTLRSLELYDTNITHDGAEAFDPVICDETSLNSVADSNHSCTIESDHYCNDSNESENRGINRGKKIYRILSLRNGTMSNSQHFGDINVKLLPNILEAAQKYSSAFNDRDKSFHVKSLSIVYEIMRRWDKVTPLYKHE